MKKSPVISSALNEHYNLNFQLGIEYLSLSQQVYNIGMQNLANYIKKLAEDKLTIHKDKLFNYLVNQNIAIDGKIQTSTCKTYAKPVEMVKHILDHEENVKEKILELSNLSLKENDHETFHFLTWFVNDGVKDYGEVKNIYNLFSLSDDILAIDQSVKDLDY